MVSNKSIIKTTSVLLSVVFLSSCATFSADEYPNITFNNERKVETVKFTHSFSSDIENRTECVLEYIENDDIPIEHSLGLWAPMLVHLVVPNKEDKLARGEVIISNEDDVLQAVGNLVVENTILNGRKFLLFQLTLSNLATGGTELLFTNPSIVFEDTGIGKNKGAIPLGVHAGSGFEINYQALDKLSDQLGSCLRRT